MEAVINATKRVYKYVDTLEYGISFKYCKKVPKEIRRGLNYILAKQAVTGEPIPLTNEVLKQLGLYDDWVNGCEMYVDMSTADKAPYIIYYKAF